MGKAVLSRLRRHGTSRVVVANLGHRALAVEAEIRG
jgi:hypothetical protein